jgi:hypothetical protein
LNIPSQYSSWTGYLKRLETHMAVAMFRQFQLPDQQDFTGRRRRTTLEAGPSTPNIVEPSNGLL